MGTSASHQSSCTAHPQALVPAAKKLKASTCEPACARVGCCSTAPSPTSREKRVTQGTPAGVSSKPLRDPLCGHGDPRDPSPWNRMAFSGKGSQWARNSHHYVQSLPRESSVSLLGALADPRAASRGGPRPHALPESQSAHSPWQKQASLLWLSITLSLTCRANRSVFFHQKTSCSGFPQISPSSSYDLSPKKGKIAV